MRVPRTRPAQTPQRLLRPRKQGNNQLSLEKQDRQRRENQSKSEELLSAVMFSTVFSTVVEILGNKPKRLLGMAPIPAALATVAHDANASFFDSRDS
jgi:hypothetical protein